MRTRIKIKPGLLGSSDFTHVQANRVSLDKNHKLFIGSELHIALTAKAFSEPDPNKLVRVRVWGKPVLVPYKKAKALNFQWEYV